jgi:hypothetical protein
MSLSLTTKREGVTSTWGRGPAQHRSPRRGGACTGAVRARARGREFAGVFQTGQSGDIRSSLDLENWIVACLHAYRLFTRRREPRGIPFGGFPCTAKLGQREGRGQSPFSMGAAGLAVPPLLPPGLFLKKRIASASYQRPITKGDNTTTN